MTAKQIIDSYLSFFEKRGHTKIAGAPLVPENDPTTLFTSSGMQPLVPYLLGEKHPGGTRLVDVQNCFRAQDIDEIGNNRHTTFFRMLGNWSLGDYFKEEQLPWFWEFLTKELQLNPNKLYVTVYAGEGTQKVEKNGLTVSLELDNESINIWKNLFKATGINAEYLDLKDFPQNVTQEEINKARIFSYGSKKNWWSRSGTPDKMPQGEPGGPDSEVFYDFGIEYKFHENSQWKNEFCHPNCDCGRFMEIGNSVFMQYLKQENGNFKELPNKNVDFGGGLERLIAATNNDPDIFRTDCFKSIIDAIRQAAGLIVDPDAMYEGEKYYLLGSEGKKIYEQEEHVKFVKVGKDSTRIIADHMRSAVFLVSNHIYPSNKAQGYVLRKLIRRSMLRARDLGIENNFTKIVVESVITSHKDTDPYLVEQKEEIIKTIEEEEQKFRRTLKLGLSEFEKYLTAGLVGKPETEVKMLAPEDIFKLYESYGFPYELSQEEGKKRGILIPSIEEFNLLLKEHQNLSRTQSAGKFKGGLADAQELTIKGHTATHLLHQAIRDLLGNDVHQSGSNITVERLRFDFNFDRKLTDEEIKSLEQTVNEKIKEDLPVHYEMLPLSKAKEIHAIGLFDAKYQEQVKVYIMGGSGTVGDYNAYSKEFCGGPHVAHTGEIKSFKITKQEKIGTGLMRLYAVVS